MQIMSSTKKIATMLRSGLSILPSLEMVRDQVENPTLKETVNQIYIDVESGSSLSQSFTKHPDIFNAIYINMVKAGESSGRLDIFLDKLVLSIRKTIKIRKSIQSAMLYPAILLIVATVVVGDYDDFCSSRFCSDVRQYWFSIARSNPFYYRH